MAARTSAASGNWNAGGTWTGGVAPGIGDTATVTHTVTVTANVTMGTSPAAGTPVLTVSGAGVVAINAGIILSVRGDIAITTGATINVGSGVLEMDGSVSGLSYTCATSGTGMLTVFGTLAQRGIVRSRAGDTNHGKLTGQIDVSQGGLLRLGGASTPACGADLSPAGRIMRFRDCVIDTCGVVANTVTPGAGSILELTRTTFKNSLGTFCADLTWFGADAAATGVVDDCVFDIWSRFTAGGGSQLPSVVQNNVFNKVPEIGNIGGTNPTAWQNNLIRDDATGIQCVVATSFNSYLLQHHTTINPHGLQPASDANVTLDGWIIEYTGTDDTGDCIVLPAALAALTYRLKNVIILPNGGGDSSGSLFSALGGANTTFSAEHCTVFVGNNLGATVAETYAGHAGMLEHFRDSIFWDTIARGYKLSWGTTGSVANIVTPANAHHNVGHNLLAGTSGNGYNNLTPATGYGATDIVADPEFVDDTRNFKTWDASIAGGAGSVVHGLAELAKRNDATGYNPAYSIANLMAWVWAGFVPQNSALEAASDSVAPTNGWIGALEGAAVAPPAAAGLIFRSRVIR